jgi:hypothetical protein
MMSENFLDFILRITGVKFREIALRALVVNEKRRSFSRTMFKYEHQMALYIVEKANSKNNFLDTIFEETSNILRKTASDEFTFADLSNFVELKDKKILTRHNSTFLGEKVRLSVESAISSCFLNATYLGSSYFGDAPNLRVILLSAFIEAFDRACAEGIKEWRVSPSSASFLNSQIRAASEEGLEFKISHGRFGYVSPQADVSAQIFVEEMRNTLEKIKKDRIQLSNEHPELVSYLESYNAEICKEKPDMLRLLILGGDVQLYIARFSNGDIKSDIPPLDEGSLGAIDTFMLRHGLIMSSSKEMIRIATQYEKASSIIGINMQETILPTIGIIRSSDKVFDVKTTDLAEKVVAESSKSEAEPSKRAAAVALARGSLAAIGGVILEASKDGIKDVLKEDVKNFLSDPKLRQSTVAFMRYNGTLLLRLAERAPVLFGWVKSLLRLIG